MTSPLFVATSPSPAICVAATPDFVQCCSAHEDGSVQEYDWFGSINCTANPESAAFASALARATPAVLGRWSTFQPTQKIDAGLPAGTADPVTAVAVHSEAVWLLTGHRSGKIKLFTSRLHKGMLHYYNHNHQGPIAGIALANKQTAAVAASYDRMLSVLDLNTRQFACYRSETAGEMAKHLRRFVSLTAAPTPDGAQTMLATTTEDGFVSVWSTTSGGGGSTLLVHNCALPSGKADAMVTSVAWGPDKAAPFLVLGCRDGAVQKWNMQIQTAPVLVAAFRLPSLLSGPNLVYALCPVRDSIAVAGEDCVRLYMWGTVAAHQARQQQITQQQQMAQQQAGHQRAPAPTPGQDGGPGSGSGGASAPRKRRRAVPISCNVLLQSAGVSAMCASNDGRFLLINSQIPDGGHPCMRGGSGDNDGDSDGDGGWAARPQHPQHSQHGSQHGSRASQHGSRASQHGSRACLGYDLTLLVGLTHRKPLTPSPATKPNQSSKPKSASAMDEITFDDPSLPELPNIDSMIAGSITDTDDPMMLDLFSGDTAAALVGFDESAVEQALLQGFDGFGGVNS